MKNIILFSRCELVHLYGGISEYLSKTSNVIHIAYSEKEESILRQNYSISKIINFKREISLIYNNETKDNLLCNSIDELIIQYSNNRFNLNSAIQSDRTFQYLSYDDCLILCQTYYKFWNELFTSKKIDFILHEPNSLFMNQITSILSDKFGTRFITLIQVYGQEKINYLIVTSDNSFSEELKYNIKNNQLSIEESKKTNQFLEQFRSTFTPFFNAYTKNKDSFLKLIYESFKLILNAFKKTIRTISIKKDTIDHLELFLLNHQSFFTELHKKWSSNYFLRYDEYNPELKYYYYPIHLEPEAVVLYWGDGIYKNQVKLIENIAAQLPPNCYLYVKDHPHAGAYRDYADYKKIKAIPNVKLLNPALSGKSIIKNSIGVITINGTSGFEALLMNKQVFTFGNCFYNQCPRVKYIHNIRDLRQTLYSNFNITYEDDEVLFNFVSTYLKSIHPGFTDYFINYPKLLGIDEEKNAEIVAKGLLEYFDICESVS